MNLAHKSQARSSIGAIFRSESIPRFKCQNSNTQFKSSLRQFQPLVFTSAISIGQLNPSVLQFKPSVRQFRHSTV